MAQIERIKLFHYPASRSARVKWALHEVIGDGFEVERRPRYSGASFAFLGPGARVPTLEITRSDRSVRTLCDSDAIVTWLAEAFPRRRLAPRAKAMCPDRAEYLQMMHFASSWMDTTLWQIRMHEHGLPPEARDARTAERYRLQFVQQAEPQLEARLQHMPFVCAHSFTAADILVGHCVLWAHLYGMCNSDIFARYVRRLAARPAFGRAFDDVGELATDLPEANLLWERLAGRPMPVRPGRGLLELAGARVR